MASFFCRKSDSRQGFSLPSGKRAILPVTWYYESASAGSHIHGYNPGTSEKSGYTKRESGNRGEKSGLFNGQNVPFRGHSREYKSNSNQAISSGSIHGYWRVRFFCKPDYVRCGNATYNGYVGIPTGINVIGKATPELAYYNHVCRRNIVDNLRSSKKNTSRKWLLPIVTLLFISVFSLTSCTSYYNISNYFKLSLQQLTNIEIS